MGESRLAAVSFTALGFPRKIRENAVCSFSDKKNIPLQSSTLHTSYL